MSSAQDRLTSARHLTAEANVAGVGDVEDAGADKAGRGNPLGVAGDEHVSAAAPCRRIELADERGVDQFHLGDGQPTAGDLVPGDVLRRVEVERGDVADQVDPVVEPVQMQPDRRLTPVLVLASRAAPGGATDVPPRSPRVALVVPVFADRGPTRFVGGACVWGPVLCG